MAKCNPIFEAICDVYSDDYGACSQRSMCLVDLLGKNEMTRMAKNMGLDKEYPIEWERLVGEKSDGE